MANVSSSNGLEKYPKLRFKGFSEPWKTETLGNLGAFIKGAPLSKADITDEGTPFILYGELYTTYGEVTRSIKRRTDKIVEPQFYSRVGDVIMPTSGETPEDIATASCIMLPNVILAGDLLIYRTQKVDGRLVSFVVKNKVNKQISSVAQGKSVVHVRAEELSKVAITYPSAAEQQKILTMLELLEDKIIKQRELIERLKKYKRGVIQHLIAADSDWETVRLSDILHERKTYCEKDGTYEHATLSKEGVYGKTDRYDRDFLVVDEDKKYKITKLGDLCYNPANLKFGVICLNTYGDAIFSPIYVTFEINPNYNRDFIGMLLTRTDFINQALKYQQGTVYERMAVSPEDLLSMTIRVPSLQVQTKIAKTIVSLDNRIKLTETDLTSLMQYKKQLLIEMFI